MGLTCSDFIACTIGGTCCGRLNSGRRSFGCAGCALHRVRAAAAAHATEGDQGSGALAGAARAAAFTVRFLPLIAALLICLSFLLPDELKTGADEHFAGIGLIAALAWLAILLIEVTADVLASRCRIDVADNLGRGGFRRSSRCCIASAWSWFRCLRWRLRS